MEFGNTDFYQMSKFRFRIEYENGYKLWSKWIVEEDMLDAYTLILNGDASGYGNNVFANNLASEFYGSGANRNSSNWNSLHNYKISIEVEIA